MMEGVSLISTTIVGLLVGLGVILACRKLIRDKRLGKSTCGCSCRKCSCSSDCQNK